METRHEAPPAGTTAFTAEAMELGRRVVVPWLAWLVGLTALSVVAGLVVTRVLEDSVVRFDVETAEALVASRTATVDAITAAATVLADSPNVAVLWVVAMAVAAWWTRSLHLSIFLLATIGGEKLTYLFTSVIVGRPRPSVEALGTVHATTSFPSGHIGSAFVLYGGIALAVLWHDAMKRGRWRPFVVRVAVGCGVLAIAALVGFSRMYRGHHFLSDVVWGALLGVGWLVLGWRLVLRGGVRSDRRLAS